MRAPRRVVLTRSARDNAWLRDALAGAEAEVVEYPCIGIEPIALDSQVIARVRHGLYGAAIFVSRNGVEQFFAQVQAAPPAEVVAIGRSTAEDLQRRGWSVTAMPSEARAVCAARELDRLVTGRGRVLYVRGAEGQEDVPRAVRERGQAIDEAVVYRTADVTSEPLPADERPTLLVFASPSAVRHFAAHSPEILQHPSSECLSIGPTTHTLVTALGGRGKVAERPTAEGLAATIRRWLAG